MEIKICGITNIEDALTAADCGVDALGFIFFSKSPRYVKPEAAKDIIARLPGAIVRVGVFVNADAGAVDEIKKLCSLDLIQLHGDESPDYCRQFPPEVLIKAVSPRSEADINSLSAYRVRAFLADCRDQGRYGGTGMLTDWNLAAKIARSHPLVLAGGLNAETIIPAVAAVAPGAVDICSGVERAPGKKDPEKVKDIVHIIRQSLSASTRVDKIFERPRTLSSIEKGVKL